MVSAMLPGLLVITVFTIYCLPVADMCPHLWFRLRVSGHNRCFQFYRDGRKPGAAQYFCESNDARLALVDSSHVKDYLNQAYPNRTQEYWVNVAGNQVSTTKLWSPIENILQSPSDGDCVVMGHRNGFGIILREDCSVRHRFMCQKDLVEGSRCDNKWHEYKDMCLQVPDSSSNYRDASAACRQRDATLVMTRNYKMYYAMMSIVFDIGSDIWIGIHQRADSWIIEGGTALEQCRFMTINKDDSLDIMESDGYECHEERGVICEKIGERSSTTDG